MAIPADQSPVDMSSANEQFVFSHGISSLHTAVSITNTALFFPNNIQVSRPIRAWERKPTTAFVKSRSRPRKIWRRAPSAPAELQQESCSQPVKSRHDSPKNAKRVKRRCVSSDEAVNTQWEVLSSPVKRIITRSWLSKELVALPEDKGQHDDEDGDTAEIEGTIVEIVNDDGTTTTLDDAQQEDAEEWADEEEFNDTLMHLEDAVTHKSTMINVYPEATGDSKDDTASQTHDTDPTAKSSGKHDSRLRPEHLTTVLSTYAIPAGFVSPIKRHRSVSKRSKESGRRQTLPRAFAPTVQLSKAHSPEARLMVTRDDPEASCDTAETELSPTTSKSTVHESVSVNETAFGEDWEDVEIEADDHSTTYTPSQELVALGTSQTNAENGHESYNMDSSSHLPAIRAADETPDVNRVQRSSRRKSSSPVKARKAAASHETSHIVAFTPIKRATNMALRQQSMNSDSSLAASLKTKLVPQTPPSLLRSSGNSPQQVRRAEKLRLSDDTVLLQAFLDRVAQKKRTGAQNAEDGMEQKSTSSSAPPPASAGVLLDLDPNTASPRKAVSSLPLAQDNQAQVSDELETTDSDVDARDDSSSHTKRRHRDTRRSQRIMTTAPAKITLRGIQDIQDSLASKRTPAKELFILTGKNTRANKADAVPPAQRVPALMAELLDLGFVVRYPALRSTKKKTVTWDKAPVYFNFDPPEDSADSNDTETPPQPQADGTGTTELGNGEKAAVEPLKRRATPGTPRVTQLRAPNASTNIPSSTTMAQIPSALETTSTNRKAFRSSIAAPIKRLSLAAPEKAITVKTGIPSIVGQTKLRRKMPSRLPAPVSALETASIASLPAPEATVHASIMSPPKRRAALFIPSFEIDATKSDSTASAVQAPRLASPAKKPRRPFTFDGENQGSKPAESNTKMKEVPGLSSPAKKRARKVY